MQIVALLTDFGLRDNFAGVIKGVILNINPQAQIVDISHNVANHNIREGAFLLLASFVYFPKGTIFVAVIDPGVGSLRNPIAIKTKNYFFVGPDNGVLYLAAARDGIKERVVLENKKFFLKNISSTFHGRDIFAPVAAYLSKNTSFLSLGKPARSIKEIVLPSPKIEKVSLEGEIIYVDNFGNLITNMQKECFTDFTKGRFVATLNNKMVSKLYSCYAQAQPDEPFFVESGFGYLEIALKDKSAEKYFGLRGLKGQKLIIKRVL
jgi:S-adenosylmethionine hydrolase